MLEVAIVRRSGVMVQSMERFAEAIEGSRVDPGLRIKVAGNDCRIESGSKGRATAQWRRWVVQPLALRRLTSDVYHVLDHSDAHLLRAVSGRPAVVTCHDLMLLRAVTDVSNDKVRRWWVARFRWSVSHLHRATAIACPSEATRADVIELCDIPPERVHVIPQGVSRQFRPLGPDSRRTGRRAFRVGDRRVMLHVTSGAFYKNSQATLRVLASLVSQGMNVVLIRVGAPLDTTERDIVQRLDVADRVIESGRITEAELVALYNAADVLLFPSIYEGFGWPVLEAMACGLPVVISTIDSLMELAGPAQRNADPNDIPGLATEVATILEDSAEAERLRRLGLTRAEGYGWDKPLLAYARLYRSIAS